MGWEWGAQKRGEQGQTWGQGANPTEPCLCPNCPAHAGHLLAGPWPQDRTPHSCLLARTSIPLAPTCFLWPEGRSSGITTFPNLIACFCLQKFPGNYQTGPAGRKPFRHSVQKSPFHVSKLSKDLHKFGATSACFVLGSWSSVLQEPWGPLQSLSHQPLSLPSPSRWASGGPTFW